MFCLIATFTTFTTFAIIQAGQLSTNSGNSGKSGNQTKHFLQERAGTTSPCYSYKRSGLLKNPNFDTKIK